VTRDVVTALSALAPLPDDDFSASGDVELQPLGKIQQLTGAFLGRNWVTIPHVTHHDEVDVSAAEQRRSEWSAAHPEAKLTPVALQVKALARALVEMPQFNASLSQDGKTLILKRFVNIGVAVDTPRGLLVPVIAGANEKSLPEIASALAQLAEKARSKGLSMAEMSGGCITLSSLGHIGGTSFTPIINAPELAILGTLAMRQAPVPDPDGGIAWRTLLPLSLSYDHRVINGSDAARFVRAVGGALNDPALFA
jgi:pyruvate dehydrogenase E2 component (dihydrolipoamide acetyltransferase)